MRFTLLTQLALLLVSVVIIMTFIRPAFGEIKSKQDENFRYQDTVAKAEALNQELQNLVAKRDAFSVADRATLNLFVPERIDPIKVMRDIESIFKVLNKPILSLSANDLVLPQSPEESIDTQLALPEAPLGAAMVTQDFKVSFVGSYEDIKQLLVLTERNQTLLEVMSLDFDPLSAQISAENRDEDLPEGAFSVSLTLRAFGLEG
jgi:hypothetical protein